MEVNITELVGKVLTSIDKDIDYLIFNCEDGTKYKMYHYQDCRESVTIDDICGDLDDLIGVPILKAEEVSNSEFEEAYESSFKKQNENDFYLKNEDGDYKPDSYTWTFYKLATIKGYVDVRWFGTSNGYYSESVSFIKADENGEFSWW